eukprot:Pgem_evm1s11085
MIFWDALVATKRSIVKREYFDAHSFSILFAGVGIVTHQFIFIGDLLNVLGVEDNPAYANWTVLVSNISTSAYTSVCSLLLTQLFVAIKQANSIHKTSVMVTYLSRFSTFYSFVSPVLFIALNVNNINDPTEVYDNHNIQLFTEFSFILVMLVVTLTFACYYNCHKNPNFLEIIFKVGVIMVGLLVFVIEQAIIFSTNSDLSFPASVDKWSEVLLVSTVIYSMLHRTKRAKKIKIEKMETDILNEYIKNPELYPVLVECARNFMALENVYFLNCLINELQCIGGHGHRLSSKIDMGDINTIFQTYIDEGAPFQINISSSTASTLYNDKKKYEESDTNALTIDQTNSMFEASYHEVVWLVKQNLLPTFLNSSSVCQVIETQQRNKELTRRLLRSRTRSPSNTKQTHFSSRNTTIENDETISDHKNNCSSEKMSSDICMDITVHINELEQLEEEEELK